MKQNSFKFLIYHDFIEGILRRWKYFLVAFIFFSFVCAAFLLGFNSFLTTENNSNPIGMTEFIANFFAGTPPFNPESKTRIDIPIIWLSFHSLLSLIVGFYIHDDLKKNACSFLLRMRSKKLWWSSKFVWCLACVFMYYLLFFLTTVIFSLLFGEMSLAGNALVCNRIFDLNISAFSTIQFISVSLIVPLVMSMAISVFQVALSLLVKPMYAFVFVLVLSIVSCFYSQPFLLFNFSMIKRYNFFYSESGITIINGFVIAAFIIIASYIGGRFLIQKKDIL